MNCLGHFCVQAACAVGEDIAETQRRVNNASRKARLERQILDEMKTTGATPFLAINDCIVCLPRPKNRVDYISALF